MMSTSALIRTIRKAIDNELAESSLQALLQEPITSMSDHTARELHTYAPRGTPLIGRNQDELDQALDSMRSEK
jgi:hypothetical protein